MMNLPEVVVFALTGLLWALVVLGVAYLYRRTLPGERRMSSARIVATAFGVGAGLLGLTALVTSITPVVLVLILVSAFAHHIQPEMR